MAVPIIQEWNPAMTTATDLRSPESSHRVTAALDITVLSGGPGAEREVSLDSGRAVAAALTRLGHHVAVLDISPQHLSALEQPADLIFIALHGTFGEDGQLQSILEQRGLPFVGSGSAASRLAMNKAEAKARFSAAGIPTPNYEVVTRKNINHAVHSWKLPAVIKPVDQGSSVDTFIVKDAFAYQSALDLVVRKYGSCLIEEYIKGPELTVGILGDMALPVCQIVTRREFYDYIAKYRDDATQYLFDIELPAALLDEVQAFSLKAHRTLGCRGFSRVDWMVSAATQRPYILEVNTIPGFTDHSLLPKASARVNLSFEELCGRIVELALADGP